MTAVLAQIIVVATLTLTSVGLACALIRFDRRTLILEAALAEPAAAKPGPPGV